MTLGDVGGADLGAARALTAGLVDDAAVFPPGNAALPIAVEAHVRACATWWGGIVGPLVLPASAVEDLLALPDGPASALDPLEVVLVADTGLGGLAEARNRLLDVDAVTLVGVEVAVPRDGDLGPATAALLDALDVSVPAAVEVPLGPGVEAALDVLADDGAERAKFRCGGATAATIPSADDLAAAVIGCLERDLPFKCTAGLHRALRGQDATEGRPHHGFGNLLAAVAAGRRGAGVGEVAAALASTSADAVRAALLGIDGPGAVAVRRSLTSIGSCSLADPRDDLRGLGLLGDDVDAP